MMHSDLCTSVVRFPSSRFTGKERDTESGNDYFFARYYSSALGRFTTPDWSAKVVPVPYAAMGDPQSLNLYAYVRNNPLSRVDEDGHCDGEKDAGCNAWQVSKDQKAQQQNAQIAQNNTPPAPGQNGQPQNTNTKQLSGNATEYDLPGSKLAYGGKFDGTKMAAAMTPDRAKNGQTVTVSYTSTDANGNAVTTTIRVVVNDTGPFALDSNGKLMHPVRPNPTNIIDLTPTAMKALTGHARNRVPVTVTVPNE